MRARWTAGVVILALAFGACGGGATDPDDRGPGAATPAAATPIGGGGGGGGSVNGPITVEVSGETYAMDIGTCDVTDAVIRASAGRSDGSITSVGIQVSDEAGTSLVVTLPGSTEATLQLAGGDAVAGSTWDARVDGTTAVIEAILLDDSVGATREPVEATITIRCAERGFGGLAAPPTDAPAPPVNEPVPTTPGLSTITLDFAGTVSTFEYPGCPLTEARLGFVVVNSTLTRLAVSESEVDVVLPDGTRYRNQAADVQGSGTEASWSGTLSSPAGDVPVTVTIACG